VDAEPMGLQAYLDAYPDIKDGPLYGTSVTVSNWGEYLDESLNRDFRELTGVTVNYTYFETNEKLYSAMRTGGSSYDVVVPSDYMIGQLIEEGLLNTINAGLLDHYHNIQGSYVNTAYDPENKYSVPYMTGTVGLVYNKAAIAGPVDSWSVLFDPQYSGQILMFDNPRDAAGIALKLLGKSFNTTDEDDIRAAFDLLAEQKPIVQAYVMDQIYDKLESGEALIGPYYAGDAVIMMEENEDLAFVHPKEGMNMFIDAFCIPESAENVAGAYLYIDFMCTTDSGLRNVEATGYTTPLENVYHALDDETRLNPLMYPPGDVISRGEVFLNLPEETRVVYNDLWSRLLSG
jgi:spermidine/putrescine transport system substrate-binding protein